MLPVIRLCLVLSAFLGAITFVSSARVGRDSHNYRYGVIFDAGSTSTKLHVYRWDQNRLPTKMADLTELKLSGTRKVKPGISSYVTNPQFVKPQLILLLYSAKTVVPEKLHSSTPVYVKATAGMRLLKPADTNAIFDQINDLFLNTTFNPFKFERGWAKVISGEEEGVFGWITVNFLKGVFDSKIDTKTFGALDMGGGSTQITFLPTGQFYANLFPLYIAGRRYDLYTNSFLKFGLDQYRLQMYQHLYRQTADKNATIDSPCDLKGYNTSVDIGGNKMAKIKGTGNPTRQCRGLVRQLLGLNDTCYTEPYLHSSVQYLISLRKVFFLTGTGNPTRQCRGLVRQLLGLNDTCYTEPCSIVGEYQPPVGDTVFYATAAYYYVSQVGGGVGAVPKKGGFTSVNNIQAKTDDYCALSYAQSINQTGEYGFTRCVAGHYLAALLGDGYKTDVSAADKVYITEEINGVEIGWALGSMLYEMYLLNINFAVGSASHVTSTSLAFILAIMSRMLSF